MPLDVYRAQGRGGRGIRGSDAKEGDVLKSLFVAGTHDYLLCFSNRGQVYWLKVYQLPEASRTAHGPRDREPDRRSRTASAITNVLRVPEFDDEQLRVLRDARAARSRRRRSRPTRGPRRAASARSCSTRATSSSASAWRKPGDTIMLGTADGQAIRFDEAAARAMGRTASGVRGIRLRDGRPRGRHGRRRDADDASLLTVCENGYGKRTPLEDYPIKGRGGQGVINIQHRRAATAPWSAARCAATATTSCSSRRAA